MRSGFERTLAAQLKRAKVPFEYETLKLPYSIDHDYKPDFILGNGVIIEAKGVLNKYDQQETRKMLAIKAKYPHLDIRFVFMNADRKVPRMKTTHAQWAERHGFPWAHAEIPKEWYE